MPETDWNRVACLAYEAHAQVLRAEQAQLPPPEWETLGPREHAAWREAAKAVEQALEATEESNT
jgi:hypothetical protein